MTKIINILKDDSFKDIFDIFQETSAKEVIFVLPKKSKAFKKEADFSVLSKEAERQSKTVSLLCSNPEINELAEKYNFEVLLSEKEGGIKTVNQYEEEDKPRLEAKKYEKLKDLPPWGDMILPGMPSGDLEMENEPPKKPKLKLQVHSEPKEIEIENPEPQYQFMHAVKIKKVEDIIPPADEESAMNIKIKPKKERPSQIHVKTPEISEEEGEKILDDITKVWEEKSDRESKLSSIWADWNLGTSKEKSSSKKNKGFAFKWPEFNWKFKKSKITSQRSITYLILVSIFILGTLIYISTGSAKIIINPLKKGVDLRFKVIASDKYTSFDPASNRIPGQLFTVEKELSQKFNATGQKDAVQKARGKITIYNELSSPQPLIATTRFESEAKLVFRTLTSITVPAAKTVSGKTTPGKIDVEVIADKAGPEYNLTVGRFVVVAFREKGDNEKYNAIYATSATPMHGGINGKSTVVSDSDYGMAKKELTDKLTTDLQYAMKSQTAQFKVIDNAGLNFRDPVSSAQPEDAATEFEMKLSAFIKTIGFKEDDLFQLINKEVQKNGNFEIIPENAELSFEKVKFDSAKNTLEFEVVVKGGAYAKIDKERILDDLTNKNQKDIKSYFEENPDIESAKVILSPFWIKKLPEDRTRVDFQITF